MESIRQTLTILSSYHRLVRQVYPSNSLRDLKNRLLLSLLALLRFPHIAAWYCLQQHPRLAQALECHPSIRFAIFCPYLNNRWGAAQRLAVIQGHYQLLEGVCSCLATVVEHPVTLANLSMDKESSPLQLVLDKPEWFAREGELVLNLFQDELRLFSLAFTLGIEGEGKVAFIGAIQGSNHPGAADRYRHLTRLCHGQRPRDLLINAFRILCQRLEVGQILGVNDATRHHVGWLSTREFNDYIKGSYDAIWLEQGGQERADGFFQLPVQIHYREMDAIPAKKRASYRRRYEMLDGLIEQINRNCLHPQV